MNKTVMLRHVHHKVGNIIAEEEYAHEDEPTPFFTICPFNPFPLYIYTHFNKLKKKAFGKHCGKR